MTIQRGTRRTRASLFSAGSAVFALIVVAVASAQTPATSTAMFWPADAYHQHYYKTHAAAYQIYRVGCGRDAQLRQLWGSSP